MAINTKRRFFKVCSAVWILALLGCVLEQRTIVADIKSNHVFRSSGTSWGTGAPEEVWARNATEKAGDAEASLGRDGTELLALVAYLSAPGNFAKRRHLRQTCLPKVWEQCQRFAAMMGGGGSGNRNRTNEADASFDDARRICDVKFFVGQPNDPSVDRTDHRQGVLSTELEIELARSLQNETDAYGDLSVIPMRDSYQDLPDKTLHILREGVLSGARIIVKIDDDMCPDMTSVLNIARNTQQNDARYIGYYQWRGDEYEIMKGADGRHGPYMSGPVYLVSSALARAVAIDDAAHSALYMPYGSSSEDVDMGQWYQHAMGTHPHLNFKREVVGGLAKGTGFEEERAKAEAKGMI